jgi:hypothetical protein
MALDPLTAFTVETWTYLGISLLIAFARFGLRWRWLGFRGLNADDHLMIVAGVSPSLFGRGPLIPVPDYHDCLECVLLTNCQLLFTAETATAHFVGAYWQGMSNDGYVFNPYPCQPPVALALSFQGIF